MTHNITFESELDAFKGNRYRVVCSKCGPSGIYHNSMEAAVTEAEFHAKSKIASCIIREVNET